jgi:Phosphodiester glycosidase
MNPIFVSGISNVFSRFRSFLTYELQLHTSLAVLLVAGFVMIAAVALSGGLILSQQNSSLYTSNKTLQSKLDDALYQNQIYVQEQRKLDEEKKTLDSKLQGSRLNTIDSVYALYSQVLGQIQRNSSAKLDVSVINAQSNTWGTEFLSQQFSALTDQLNVASKNLDDQYAKYLASLPKPSPPPVRPQASQGVGGGGSANGYSQISVATSRGTFVAYLVKLPLASYSVKTVTGNTSDCTNNCPNQALGSYVQQNGGYAGINGTYFCPPDYSNCSGKTYSYDWAVYNSSLGKWLNATSLSWSSVGLATWSGDTPHFYRYNYQYPGSSITAGISNFPVVLQGGNILDTSAQQTSAQKVKGTRGSIGTDGSNVYLSLVSSANVDDSAYVLQALGEKDALNLDGGGSSALYVNGSYKVGPGRSLPNVVVLIHK